MIVQFLNKHSIVTKFPIIYNSRFDFIAVTTWVTLDYMYLCWAGVRLFSQGASIWNN